MFTYERDGERIERDYRPGHAPPRVRVGGKLYKRAIEMPALALGAAQSVVNGKSIDFVSELPAQTYGKFHKGKIVTDGYGNQRLHFNSRDQIDHLRRAYNGSAEAERSGKKLRYGECDEWSDDIKRGHCVEPEHVGGGPETADARANSEAVARAFVQRQRERRDGAARVKRARAKRAGARN